MGWLLMADDYPEWMNEWIEWVSEWRNSHSPGKESGVPMSLLYLESLQPSSWKGLEQNLQSPGGKQISSKEEHVKHWTDANTKL